MYENKNKNKIIQLREPAPVSPELRLLKYINTQSLQNLQFKSKWFFNI